jgi:hypothetical protein
VIDLIAKIIDLVAGLCSSLIAWNWARERARRQALEALLEKQDAIRKARELGPRTQSDAARRLREGTF